MVCRRRYLLYAGLAALALLVSAGGLGCAARAQGPKVRLTVFAAASLRDAFEALAEAYRAAHPEVQVVLNFAGSQQLRTQVEQGAQPDLFASADRAQLARLYEAGSMGEPMPFATNELALAVSERCSAPVHSLGDLPGVHRIVLGAPEVPVGAYSQELLEKAGDLYGSNFRAEVESKVVSRELNVRQLLAKVALGEADAGLVYRSDLTPAPPGVRSVSLPDSVQVQAGYWISFGAAADGSVRGPSQAAARWLELLSSAEGHRILEERGFTP